MHLLLVQPRHAREFRSPVRFRPSFERHALDLAQKAGLTRRIDRERLRAAVRAQRGVPVDITLAPARPQFQEARNTRAD